MGEKPADIKLIFGEALEKKTADERAAFLDKACGNDPDLRNKVEALLRAYEEADDVPEGPIIDPEVTLGSTSLTEGPGSKIGHYKLLQLIGEGGFGAVYMAEQESPIRRRVALKIIKLGMDTKQVIARFEAERQALAMMDHPNIARVFDAGATETGRPYFVMELVKGIPMTEYCDKNNLDTSQRLKLFIDVCKAVQHAHQKGVIHRDIKPSNVMITLHDGKPVPKIIDFGIAKATQHRLTEKTLFTEFRQFIGTPEYMSPEQAEMSGLDVDTRSDIYSLGVLLYELLTGTTPFEAEKLRRAAYDEMRRIIREDEPLRPSMRLSTLGDALTDIAKHRHVLPGELCRIVHGDLDWIVMKALEKDRTRRYETANEMTQDIQRHLDDKPVVASPPSTLYRAKKFIRRNRALVTGVAAVLVVLVAGIVVSTIFAIGQYHARAIADKARQAEAHQRQIAETARERAVTAQHETQLANEKLIWENYVAAIGISEGLIQQGSIKHARALLDNCPAEHRHWEWGRLQYLCNQDTRTIKAHSKRVRSLALSPDGKYLATAGLENIVKLWSPDMEQILMEMPGAGVAFSPDSRYLAVGSPKNENLENINLWDLQAGRIVQTFKGYTDGAQIVAFSPDGKLIVSVGFDKIGRIWEVTKGKERYQLPGSYGGINRVAFSPDGKYVATGHDASWQVVLWDVETGKALRMHRQHNNGVTGLAFTPDSQYLYSGGMDLKVIRWNIHTDTAEQMQRTHVTEAGDIAIDRDGKFLVITNADATVGIYDLKTHQEIHVFKGHNSLVIQVASSPNGKYLVTGGRDGNVKFWDLERLQRDRLRLKGHTGDINAMAFSPDGQYLATGAGNWNIFNDHTARIWDLESGHLLHDLTGHHLNVDCLAFSPDGTTLATGSWDKTVKIWSVGRGEKMQTLKGHNSAVLSIAFHPNERFLASGSSDGSTKIWDLTTGQMIRALYGHSNRVRAVAYSPDGRLLATGGSWDKTVKIWDVEKGIVLRELKNHKEHLCALAFSNDGRLLASGSYDNTARIWEVRTGREVTVLRGHKQMVGALTFSPDDKRLVTASSNSTAKIWDVKTGQKLITFSSGMNRKPSLAVSPDGRLIAIARGHEAVILPAFPWREQDYPGDSSMPLQERIELYKHDYWKQQAQNVQVKTVPFEQATPIQKERMLLESLMKRTCELGPEHPDTLNCLDKLLGMYEARGKWTVGLLEELVAEYPDAPDLRSRLVTDLVKLGYKLVGYYESYRTFKQAETVCKELLEVYTNQIEINPENIEAYLKRGNVYLIGLNKYDEAVLDYSAAIEMSQARGESIAGFLEKLVSDFPDSPDLRSRLAEGLTKLGDNLKKAGRTDEAELIFRKAEAVKTASYRELLILYTREVESNPENVYIPYSRALANLGMGNMEGYRKGCTDVLDKFGQTEEPDDARWIAWTCALAPDAVEDFSNVIDLAMLVIEKKGETDRDRGTLGAVLYRAGKFNEALQQLSELAAEWEQGKALPTLDSPAYTWFFLAMAHHQLGSSDEAKYWFDKAIKRSDEELQGTPLWNRRLTLQLLQAEAGSLLGISEDNSSNQEKAVTEKND